MGSVNMILIETVTTPAGTHTTFDCDTTPAMVNHQCIITLDATGQTGGNLTLEASDDGTTWATAVDSNGNNITVAAAAAQEDFPYVLPNHVRLNNTGRTAGGSSAYIKAA